MGNIGSVLKGKEVHEVFIDFENAKPTNGEMKIYSLVDDVLKRAPDVLKKIEEYKGCQDLARKAMSTPTYENEKEAFEGLLAAVDSIATFFDYAKSLERVLPELLLVIAKGAPSDEKGQAQSLADQQALAKQLADIFDFTLRFDQTRMMRPHLSNDFSYYRRLLPKFSKLPQVKIKDDEASGMALFTAEHIPMMSCLSKAAARALEKNEHVTTALSVMANSCMKMVKSKKFAKAETNLFCARSMTGSIVLYDHVDPLSAVHKRSPIQIKQCILLLKREFPRETSLMNAIRFSTKNFRNAPSSIQDLFD
jgi:hypothetical protein